jgi:hypothetical protein
MRQINWDDKLSDEDIAWLRTTGIVGIEDRIARHQEQYDAQVPEDEVPDDEVTQSALDAQSRANTPAETGDGPVQVDPTQADPQGEFEDDYDEWTLPSLKSEVKIRNDMEGTGQVEIVGTGTNGAQTKADIIKGLRLWDAENPEVPTEE